MASNEFQQYFGNFNADQATEVADRWFNAPTYVELPKEENQRFKALTELTGDVKLFVEQTTNNANELVKAERQFEALDLVDQRLKEAEKVFEGDDLLTARRYTFYRRSYVQEHLATFGSYSKLPLGDPMRTICFLSAARDYMLADLELGCVTDYGLRVSECFGGARNGNAQMAALDKCFGGLGDVTLVHGKSPDMIIVKDLERRATETVEIGEVPGGGSARIISGEYPDPKLN